MIHYSCDICRKEILACDVRFVVHIDLRPAESSFELTEEDIDEDNLHQISEALKELEASGEDCFEATPPAHFRFDLCSSCREIFATNPLAAAAMPKLNFSEN